MFETLEDRRMLSVTAKFDDAAATYRVTGSEDKEHIEVVVDTVALSTARSTSRFAASTWAVYERVRVFDGGTLVATEHQPRGSIKAVRVDALGGDDVVVATNNGQPARLFVDGGDGNDSLEARSVEGAPGNTIWGGADNDAITLTVGKGSTEGGIAFGGAGNDTVTGSAFDDQLFGDNAANDKVENDGDDVLFGNAGNDALFGGAGNDYLDGQTGADKLDGGEGFDTAIADKEDPDLSNVEQVVDGGDTL